MATFESERLISSKEKDGNENTERPAGDWQSVEPSIEPDETNRPPETQKPETETPSSPEIAPGEGDDRDSDWDSGPNEIRVELSQLL